MSSATTTMPMGPSLSGSPMATPVKSHSELSLHSSITNINSNNNSNTINNSSKTSDGSPIPGSVNDDVSSGWKSLPEAEVPTYLSQFGVSVVNAFEWPSAPPEISLQVSGRSTSGSHTVYAVECSFRAAAGSSRPSRESLETDSLLQWSFPRRLTEFRSILHDPVCKALGSSYHTYFCGVPFAQRMRPAGTTARLDAWCQRLGYCISHKLVPPHIAAEVLRFVGASGQGSSGANRSGVEHVNDAGSTCTGGESSREAAEEEEDAHGPSQSTSAPSSPDARQVGASGHPSKLAGAGYSSNRATTAPISPAAMAATTATPAAATAAATATTTPISGAALPSEDVIAGWNPPIFERGEGELSSDDDDDDGLEEVELPGL